MNNQQVLEQSKAAYKQWSEQWRKNAKIHSEYEIKSLNDFLNIGVGKAVLCVANGYSFEENIETIKELQHNVDILCCDKTLGALLDNGIVPTYCMVCDANVNYEKYLQKWENQLSKTILFNNICGNPVWTEKGNWKDIYFFVNKDIISSHLEWEKISGCRNFIAAGTNVSNAMVVLLSQCDNEARRNFFGYDKIILIGYDYSWKMDGKYYAFDKDGGGKAIYMKHCYLTAPSGAYCYSSGNLIFSRDWLADYIKGFNIPAVQCSQDSILQFGPTADLGVQMSYKYKPEDAVRVRKAIFELQKADQRAAELRELLTNIGREHFMAHVCSI